MKNPQTHLPTLIPLTLVLTAILLLAKTHSAYADDPCKDISDLDDKAKCYEEQIGKNQQKYESTSKKLSDIRSQKNSVTGKINNLLSSLSVTQAELNGIQAEIDSMNKALEEIKNALVEKNGELDEKLSFRNKVIRTYSKRSFISDLELFFASPSGGTGTDEANGFQQATLTYMYGKAFNREALRLIGVLNTEIDAYERDKKEAEDLKKELEDAQSQLIAAITQLESEKSIVEGDLNVLAEAEGELGEDLAELEKVIADLSSKQQAILQAKSGDFSASLSEGVESDDPRASISYNPGFSPAFAAFSYGAYTHRNGMSQYGARGRAEDGQSYEKILKFYYKTDVEEKDDLDDKKICITGVGEMKMGEYLKGLGEMPPSWHKEALKAQAVAARTYAYRYTKNGNCICTSTNCQYFHKDLVNRSDRERWYDAIKETDSEVLKGDVSSQYSSTTGGWINGVGWDVDGSWPNDSYEKKGKSPWFYKAWFTQSTNKNSSTCGRNHPWLNGEEMADILNAYVLLKEGKNTERVVPETINKCSISGFSGKPYSKSELREKAKDAGQGFSKVSGVSGVKFGDGKTTSITFSTDQGSYTVDGQLFMKAFNLRAPGYIAIKYTPDSKALFDLVKK